MPESARKPTVRSLAARILAEHDPSFGLHLTVGPWHVRIESNSADLVDRLREYFRHFDDRPVEPDLVISAIEMPAPEFGLAFEDWKRDPGKVGRKDTYADLDDGRVCRKVRTGMQFLMADDLRLAVGPCLANDNQVINFVNSQYIAWKLHRGHVLCHAAAVASGDHGLAMAGFSGGGKSTLALHLLSGGLDFVSNDRLLVRRTRSDVEMSGVPKLPRINPGTALGNPDLVGILPDERRRALTALDPEDLWDLEEKYDVEIDTVFDQTRFRIEARLREFLILSWQRGTNGEPQIREVELEQRPDLLEAVMKSPGPFCKSPSGEWPKQMLSLDPEPYLDALRGVRIFEVAGGIDFDQAARFCLDLMPGKESRRT